MPASEGLTPRQVARMPRTPMPAATKRKLVQRHRRYNVKRTTVQRTLRFQPEDDALLRKLAAETGRGMTAVMARVLRFVDAQLNAGVALPP